MEDLIVDRVYFADGEAVLFGVFAPKFEELFFAFGVFDGYFVRHFVFFDCENLFFALGEEFDDLGIDFVYLGAVFLHISKFRGFLV